MVRSFPLTAAALSLAALAAPSALADAGRSTLAITGNGHASAAPEYVEVHVTVTSICYDSALAASQANAVLANQVVASLQTYAAGSQDKVTASGGETTLSTEQVPDGNSYRTLCTMKWRATNDLTIQMAKISDLPALQDQILKDVDQIAIDPTKIAQTYADMAAPDFAVYPATQTKLQGEADTAAYDDAKSQRDAFATRCGFTDLRLDSIEQPQYTVYPVEGAQPMPSGAANEVTPILPDQIKVDATWIFHWSFVPSANCF